LSFAQCDKGWKCDCYIVTEERERILYLYTTTGKQVLRRSGQDT